MDLGIKQKRALVCASSKGLGRAIAIGLAKEGVQLALCARDRQTLEQVAAECHKVGSPKVFFRDLDLTKDSARNDLIADIQHEFGGLDILVHNGGGPKPSLVEETDLSTWRHGFEQLFPYVAHFNAAFLPDMKQQRWGRILAITSLSVLEPIPNLAVSNAMRAAVTGMLKTLAEEVAFSGVTVNCLAPGLIHTDRTEQLLEARISRSGQSRAEYMEEYLQSVPMRRLGTPEEFAAVAVFLCSQLASYVTGSTVCIDGGKRRATY